MHRMREDMIPTPSKVIGSKNAGSLTRRSLFQWGLLGLISGIFGRGKLLANPAHATEETLDPEWLVKWRAANRIPAWESSDATVHTLIRAARLNQSVTIRYHGGSSPGELRVIAPSLVFACDGFSGARVSAYCHTRRQQRTFRLDCVSLARSEWGTEEAAALEVWPGPTTLQRKLATEKKVPSWNFARLAPADRSILLPTLRHKMDINIELLEQRQALLEMFISAWAAGTSG